MSLQIVKWLVMLLGASMPLANADEDQRHLIRQLSSTDRSIRYEAARRLAWSRTNPLAASKKLVRLLADDSPPFPEEDGNISQYFGPRVNSAAEDALVRIGAAAVPALIKSLTSEDEHLQCNALSTLAKIGPDAKQALPSIKSFLKSGSPQQAIGCAVSAWAKINSDPTLTVPVLEGMLGENKHLDFVLRNLHEADSKGKQALPILQRYLKHEDALTVYTAVAELTKFGPTAEAAVPELARLLDFDRGRIEVYNDFGTWKPLRVDAAEALASIGAPAKVAVDKLNQLSNTDSDYRYQFSAAIICISPESKFGKDALMQVTDALEQHDRMAATAMAILPAEVAVTALVSALRSSLDLESPEFVYAALESLHSHVDKAAASVTVLNQLLDTKEHEEDEFTRQLILQRSVMILGLIGKEAAGSLPKLHVLDKSTESFWLKHQFAESIWQIERAVEDHGNAR